MNTSSLFQQYSGIDTSYGHGPLKASVVKEFERSSIPQAEWLRDSSDTFLCGSLEQPRGIDTFSCGGGGALARLEDDNVASVMSLLACHPTLPILAASNSSGKCFLWR